MSLEKADLEYFDRGKIENPRFWSRLGGEPSFEGLKVLDVGCGHGSICVDVGSKGAKKVFGIDTNERLIKFAKKNVLQNYAHLKNNLDFRCCDISDLPEDEFDIILSKASFEHILNLDKVLHEMKKKLKTGEKMYIGFGPLYTSPYGDHGRIKAVFHWSIPWGHLIFPESYLIKKLNKHRREKITSIYDLGLNKLSLAEYKTLFCNSGLHVSYFRVNVSNNSISRLFSLIRRIPFLEEYFS
ncbi:unnamed protein product, partial [marine sediment metagenome]